MPSEGGESNSVTSDGGMAALLNLPMGEPLLPRRTMYLTDLEDARRSGPEVQAVKAWVSALQLRGYEQGNLLHAASKRERIFLSGVSGFQNRGHHA